MQFQIARTRALGAIGRWFGGTFEEGTVGAVPGVRHLMVELHDRRCRVGVSRVRFEINEARVVENLDLI